MTAAVVGPLRQQALATLPTAWMVDAACKGQPTTLWFPPKETDQTEPKQVCHTCPVKSECYQYALELKVEDGIWGGHDMGANRRTHRRAYNRQRSHDIRNP
jgi:WhiB family redox-sensing transcriptional regulator